MPSPSGRRSSRARSAGIVLHRRRDGELEVLLVHPGGPVLGQARRRRVVDPEGRVRATARTRSRPRGASSRRSSGRRRPPARPDDLGEIRQKSGKLVHAWALDGDLDADQVRSNTFEFEWPPRSGTLIEIPEVDRAEWFGSRPRARRSTRPRRRCSTGSPSRARTVSGSDAISPTAHYTGYVWARNGLSHPALATREGRLLFESLRPLIAASRCSGRQLRSSPTCSRATARSTCCSSGRSRSAASRR